MKFNNEYTNFVDNIELSDEFKKNLVKKIQEEADKIEHEKIKKNEEKLDFSSSSLFRSFSFRFDSTSFVTSTS